MEETINEFEEKCYVCTADVPHRSGCRKTSPEEVLQMFIRGKDLLESGCYECAAIILNYVLLIYEDYYGKLANECGEAHFFCGKAIYRLSNEEMMDSRKEVSLDGASGGVSEESKIPEGSIITKKRLSDIHQKSSWRVLEDAKLIFERQGTVQAELKVAEILQLFAEIYMDNVNYSFAIAEYNRSLKIYEKLLKPDDKVFADTYYNLGMLHKTVQMYPEALKYLQNSKQIYEMVCGNLRKTIVDTDRIPKREVEGKILDIHFHLKDIQRSIEAIEELINKKKEVKET